uniref:NADH-ubiquinone oxidoreductase chain 2 n=1 Tax=Trichogramma ostriniae TaxID=99200 RepID=A0A384SKN6_9HYME|nr:NADH dehydrogenase subunit 2 [Trichogramma ostriniae]AOM68239.1 NADH dehydrogenase subunit 2 [Trichogramma ostriniae]
MYMNYYIYILFFPMMLISNFMIFLSNTWITNWMIMEINLISFIMMMIFDKNLKNELLMNYFLLQTFNSYIFLFSSLLMNYMSMMFFFIFLMNLAMLTKLGIPPFYMWYLKIMMNLNWLNLLFMSTIQKIIPMFIFMMLMSFNNKNLFFFNVLMILFFMFIISIMGLNQVNMKLILAYSSMIQISWMMMLSYLNELIFLNYFIIYFIISMNLIFMFNKMNFLNLNQLSILKFNNKFIYILLMLLMFSLSSIPPMFGFLMKWISIELMSKKLLFFMILMMIFNSLVSMFFYIRIMFYSLMMNFYTMKMNFKFLNFKNYMNNNFLLNWLMFVMLMIYEIF